jgi:methylmalonyl-CoA/ethylmalonyl-CoA epimerase
VVVKDLDKVVQAWSNLFGFGPWTFVDAGAVRAASVFVGPIQFELMQLVEGQSLEGNPLEKEAKLYRKYLEAWGDGVHHIAFGVEDVKAEAAKLSAQGATVLTQEPNGQWAYIESSGPGSVIFELLPLSTYEAIKEKGLPAFVEEYLRILNKGANQVTK